MLIKNVNYSRLFNLGNFEHEKIGVEMEVAEGESIQSVVDQARNYVNLIAEPTKRKIAEAEEVVKNPDQYRGMEVKRAQESIKRMLKKIAQSKMLSTTEEHGSYERKI